MRVFISETNICAVYYNETFYLGQVQNLLHKDDDKKNLLDIINKWFYFFHSSCNWDSFNYCLQPSSFVYYTDYTLKMNQKSHLYFF